MDSKAQHSLETCAFKPRPEVYGVTGLERFQIFNQRHPFIVV